MSFNCGGKVMALALACIAFAGCSGGGGGGGGGSASNDGSSAQKPVVAVGKIDAFGSVFVNGVEYDTNHATYQVNDATASNDSALSVGMVVRVNGTRDGDGHGTATEVRYDEEIEGPAADVMVDSTDGTIKHFMIFGQPILANATTVFKGDGGASYAFADLADGDHVEVSGDYDGDTLIATFIELKHGSDDDFDVKGTVSDLNGSTFVLTLHSGSTLNVTLADGAIIPAGLQDGALVEVEGTIPDASMPHDFLARRVKLEDHDEFDGSGHDENEDEGELWGVLTLDGTVWSVRGTELMFSSDTRYRPDSLAAAIDDGSAAGLIVEVEGPVVDGVLQVEHIRADGRADGADELKLQGYVDGVTSGPAAGTTTITMSFTPADGTVDVIVDSQTLLMSDEEWGGVDLSGLSPGVSFIRVRGHLDETGAFIASAVKVEGQPEQYELRGPLDMGGYVQDVSISVLGVTFSLDARTFLEDDPPADGDVVEVVDRDRDGFADSVEVESGYGHEDDYARAEHDD